MPGGLLLYLKMNTWSSFSCKCPPGQVDQQDAIPGQSEKALFPPREKPLSCLPHVALPDSISDSIYSISVTKYYILWKIWYSFSCLPHAALSDSISYFMKVARKPVIGKIYHKILKLHIWQVGNLLATIHMVPANEKLVNRSKILIEDLWKSSL